MFHVRDACAADLGEIQSVLLLLFPLLDALDGELADFMRRAHRTSAAQDLAGAHADDAEMMQPIFALPWVLTLFTHSLERLDVVARLLDFFIVTHPLMPLYFAAQLILHMRSELLSLDECDFVHVMRLLGCLPEEKLPFNALIMAAYRAFQRVPPATLADRCNPPLTLKPLMLRTTHQFPEVLQHVQPAPWPSERHLTLYRAATGEKFVFADESEAFSGLRYKKRKIDDFWEVFGFQILFYLFANVSFLTF